MEIIIASNGQERETCFSLRHKIFVEGQNVPVELEKDSLDGSAIHFLAFFNKESVGVARLIIDNNIGIIGRVGVIDSFRNLGIGKNIMLSIIDHAKSINLIELKLGAQGHAINFYEKLGFQKFGEKYFDANISHFKMSLRI